MPRHTPEKSCESTSTSERSQSRSTDSSEAAAQAVGLSELNKEGDPTLTLTQLASTPSAPGEVKDVAEVDPFGDEEGCAVQYRTMHWMHAGWLMTAETISLGVLALPNAMATVGMFPGVFLLVFLGILATYTGYVIGQFKRKYPQTHSFADAGFLLGGKWLREVLSAAQILVLIFIQAAHILSFIIMMNVLTNHKTCSIIFGVIGSLVSFVLGLPRTLKNVSYISFISCLSVVSAILIAVVDIGIRKPGYAKAVAINYDTTFTDAMIAASNMVLAYAGHVAFFVFISELRKPQDFPKALFLMFVPCTIFYTLVAAIIYYYAGPYVTSPTLSSASPTVRKIAYGVASPTIIVAGVINGSVAAKYLYVRAWRGSSVIHERSWRALGSWLGICVLLWFVAWIIAEAIPNFSLLLSLISALFCGWFSYGFSGIFWLWLNKGCWFSSKRKIALTILNILIFFLGFAICVIGLYTSGKALHEGKGGRSFSCTGSSKYGRTWTPDDSESF